VLHLEYGFAWCLNLHTLQNRSEIPEHFWIVVLEKAGENQLD